MKFNGVMIGSEDPHALAAFYTSVLGEPGFHEDSWYGWDDMALMLGAHSDVHGRNATPQRIMLMIEVADMDEAFATLVGLGAKVIAEPYKPERRREISSWRRSRTPTATTCNCKRPETTSDEVTARWSIIPDGGDRLPYASLAAIDVAVRRTCAVGPGRAVAMSRSLHGLGDQVTE